MRLTYYNEIDRYCINWLNRLMARNLIPFGDIDDRPIQEVQARDLIPYRAHHFFAGIGGWAYALRLAGWPDDKAVWTGSCPCQPFSIAGSRKGTKDARHLWPDFFRLIAKCSPQRVFGEQVENAIGHGWLDGISADLEGEGYAVGAVVLGAHSVGAPHIRQRLWWVAQPKRRSTKRQRLNMDEEAGEVEGAAQKRQRIRNDAGDGGKSIRVADSSSTRLAGRQIQPTRQERKAVERSGDDGSDGLAESECGRFQRTQVSVRQPRQEQATSIERRSADRLEVPTSPRLERTTGTHIQKRSNRPACTSGTESSRLVHPTLQQTRLSRFPWEHFDVVHCLDGKTRRIGPGIFPLAARVPARVGAIKAAGNAIVPQVAAEFITAYMECVA